MGSLAIVIGPKKGGDKAGAAKKDELGDSAKEYAKLAFEASKADDEAAFVDALLGVVRSCKSDDEDEDDEE